MTRRLQICDGCGSGTRHADRRCSRCRHGARTGLLFGGQTSIRILRDPPRDLRAPTVAELAAGVEISGKVVHVDFRGRGA